MIAFPGSAWLADIRPGLLTWNRNGSLDTSANVLCSDAYLQPEEDRRCLEAALLCRSSSMLRAKDAEVVMDWDEIMLEHTLVFVHLFSLRESLQRIAA